MTRACRGRGLIISLSVGPALCFYYTLCCTLCLHGDADSSSSFITGLLRITASVFEIKLQPSEVSVEVNRLTQNGGRQQNANSQLISFNKSAQKLEFCRSGHKSAGSSRLWSSRGAKIKNKSPPWERGRTSDSQRTDCGQLLETQRATNLQTTD